MRLPSLCDSQIVAPCCNQPPKIHSGPQCLGGAQSVKILRKTHSLPTRDLSHRWSSRTSLRISRVKVMYRPQAAHCSDASALQAVPDRVAGPLTRQSLADCCLGSCDARAVQPLHCCAWGLETGSLQFQHREGAGLSAIPVLFRP